MEHEVEGLVMSIGVWQVRFAGDQLPGEPLDHAA